MLFDSTLRKELARGFGATLVVILTIVITMMLIRTLGWPPAVPWRRATSPLLGYPRWSPADDAGVLSLLPSWTLGRMYRESEMAIGSAAAWIWRFIVRSCA
jgi:lipopolysaccharide export system permease protein